MLLFSFMSLIFIVMCSYQMKLLILQRRAVYNALVRCTKPTRIWDIYAFISGPSKYNNTNPKVRLLNEYFRLLGRSSYCASVDMIEDGSYRISNELWRISDVNSTYTLCQSYPFALIIPRSIRCDFAIQSSNFLSWMFQGLLFIYAA